LTGYSTARTDKLRKGLFQAVRWRIGEVVSRHYRTGAAAVVIWMFRVLAGAAGEAAVTMEAETTLKLVAATVPNLTVVAPVKPVPVMVTVVPPPTGPEVGDTPVNAGGLGAA
jgi:hypothetical protein